MADMTVEELLECTICLDVPASPIHNCSNGHVICGICKEKVDKCGLCQSTDFEVSVVLERFSRQIGFKINCPNYEAGCLHPIPSTEIKDHTQKCYYRNVVCNEWETEACNNVSIPFQDFVQHLKEKHKCHQRVVSRCLNMLWDGTAWPLAVTTKRDKWFLMHSIISKGVAYFWTTVLGDKEEASKHMCKMTLEPPRNQKPKCWTLPVLPYPDYSNFKDTTEMFATNIPLLLLNEYCTKKTEAGKMDSTFTMSYTIL